MTAHQKHITTTTTISSSSDVVYVITSIIDYLTWGSGNYLEIFQWWNSQPPLYHLQSQVGTSTCWNTLLTKQPNSSSKIHSYIYGMIDQINLSLANSPKVTKINIYEKGGRYKHGNSRGLKSLKDSFARGGVVCRTVLEDPGMRTPPPSFLYSYHGIFPMCLPAKCSIKIYIGHKIVSSRNLDN